MAYVPSTAGNQNGKATQSMAETHGSCTWTAGRGQGSSAEQSSSVAGASAAAYAAADALGAAVAVAVAVAQAQPMQHLAASGWGSVPQLAPVYHFGMVPISGGDLKPADRQAAGNMQKRNLEQQLAGSQYAVFGLPEQQLLQGLHQDGR